MYHHDQRAYDQALKDAQDHLEKKIAEKVTSARAVIDRVMGTQLTDRVVSSQAVSFTFTTGNRRVEVAPDKFEDRLFHTLQMGTKRQTGDNAFRENLHKHAVNQAAARAGVPETFVNRMLERPYGAELITETLNTIFSKESPERFLVRSTNDEVRGVLSDSYRRMDSRPILDAFASACGELGAVPVEGIGGDLRFSVKALIPRVYVAGTKHGSEEVFAFGASLSNSDFGCGALSLQFFLWRVWCSNTATREDSLRRVHLGKRLADDITYSEETYQADTRTMTLAVKDHVKAVLAPPKIDEAVAMITKALDTTIEPKRFFDRGGELERLKLTKAEVEQTREQFNNGDVEVLPRGTNVARMSQAVAWLAQKAPSAERRLELERVAGQILEKA